MSHLKKQRLLILLLATFLFSCGRKESITPWETGAEKEDAFEQTKSLSSVAEEVNAVISIDEWFLDDTLLICHTSLNGSCFYRFDVRNWQLVDSLGRRGNGKDELIYPHLAIKAPGEYFVVDNGRRKTYLLCADSIRKSPTADLEQLVSAPKFLGYPWLGYVEEYPDKTVWRLRNIETNIVSDSLCLTNEEKQNRIPLNEICWDASAGQVVLAFLYKEQFAIGHKNPDGKRSWCLFAGRGQHGQPYYSDIVCQEDCFYLLSQKHVDMETKSGHTEVEIYDYRGKPLKLLKLDFIAKRMLVDSARNRLLLLSPQDDLIHIVEGGAS